MEPRLRASPDQFAVLVQFMERNGDLSKHLPGLQGKLRGERLWVQLCSILNSVNGGVNKSVDKWKKVWADYKTKTKKKCLEIRKNGHNTNSLRGRQPLTVLERRVIAIIGVLDKTRQQALRCKKLQTAIKIENELEEEEHQHPDNHNRVSPIQLPPDPLLEEITLSTSMEISLPLHSSEPMPSPVPLPSSVPTLSSVRVSSGPSSNRLVIPSSPPPSPRISTPMQSIHIERSPSSHSEASTSRQTPSGTVRNETNDESARVLADIEQRRLEYENEKDKRYHEREMERLKLSHEQNKLLQQLVNIAQGLIDALHQQRPSSPLTKEENVSIHRQS